MPAKKKNWKENHSTPLSELTDDLPDWFKNAKTVSAFFSHSVGNIYWIGGSFSSGSFEGEWFGGEFGKDATFNGSSFYNGRFYGTWKKGRWLGGVWKIGAKWEDPEIDRIPYMLSLMGIVFDKKGYAKAYRKTRERGIGCYSSWFVQKPGPFYIKNADPAGAGTCNAGLHACTAARALTYFPPHLGDILWEVTFHKKSLLDVDGEKIRLKKGTCRKIDWPFLTDKHLIKL